jgi:hypothetical protein
MLYSKSRIVLQICIVISLILQVVVGAAKGGDGPNVVAKSRDSGTAKPAKIEKPSPKIDDKSDKGANREGKQDDKKSLDKGEEDDEDDDYDMIRLPDPNKIMFTDFA